MTRWQLARVPVDWRDDLKVTYRRRGQVSASALARARRAQNRTGDRLERFQRADPSRSP